MLDYDDETEGVHLVVREVIVERELLRTENQALSARLEAVKRAWAGRLADGEDWIVRLDEAIYADMDVRYDS